MGWRSRISHPSELRTWFLKSRYKFTRYWFFCSIISRNISCILPYLIHHAWTARFTSNDLPLWEYICNNTICESAIVSEWNIDKITGMLPFGGEILFGCRAWLWDQTRRDLVIWTSGQSSTKDGWECMSAAVRIQMWMQLWDCNCETAIVRVQVRECNCETTVASAKWESAEHSTNIAGLGWYPVAATQNNWKNKLYTNYPYTMLHSSFPRSATALGNVTSTGAPAWMALLPCGYKKTMRKL